MADSQVDVPADDAALLASYRKLGEPAELKARLDAGDAAEKQVESWKRKARRDAVAKLHGMDPTVLAELKGVEDLDWEVNRVTLRGRTVEVGQVVEVVDGETRKTDLDKFAAERWPKSLGALKAGHADPSKPARTDLSTSPRQSAPVRFGGGEGRRTTIEDEVFADLAGTF